MLSINTVLRGLNTVVNILMNLLRVQIPTIKIRLLENITIITVERIDIMCLGYVTVSESVHISKCADSAFVDVQLSNVIF